MKNGFRKVTGSVLLVVLLAVIVIGFVWLRKNYTQRLDPQQAIPGDFVVCIESTNYPRLGSALQNQSSIWSEFREYPLVDELDGYIHLIDSLTRTIPDIQRLVDGDVLFSVHSTGDSLSGLFVFSSPENRAVDQFLKQISSDSKIEKERYENITCYHIQTRSGFLSKFSFAETKGILILSFSPVMLQRAILQVKENKNVFDGREYSRLRATTGKDVEAHIYINFERLENLAGRIIEEDKIPDLSGVGSVAALDLEVKPDHFVLNGFSSMNDSLFQLFSALQGQEPVEQGLFGVIPSSAVYLKWIGLSDPISFAKKLEGLYPTEGDHLRSFREGFYTLFNGQAAEVLLKEGERTGKPVMVVSVKSKGIAEDFLRENLVLTSGLTELASEKIPAGDDNFVMSYKIAVKGLVELLFGRFFKGAEPEWFSFVGNFLVIAGSPSELKEFMYLNSLGTTLDNDAYFQGLKENFSSRSNYFIYADPSRCYQDILEWLTPGARKIVEKNPGSWRKMDAAGFQSTVMGDMNYFRLFVHYSGQVREYVNTVWERKLDGQLSVKPAIVTNHENGEKEIFIQDEHNTISLVSNRGELIWKQKIDGKILSEVFQVDYYRNGKLQYFFNTESKLYLVDRNGNQVGNFPVELREKASAGISLLDYDNNRDYRIPVPTVERNILMYDRNGKIVPGWNFDRADHVIRFPVEHYRVGDKDFLVARDDYRLYMLDRKGKVRLRHARQIEFSSNNPVYYLSGSGGIPSRIVATDKQGDLYAFYFDGKVEKLSGHKLTESHFFVPADLDGDGKYEYIFADSSRLEVTTANNRLLFEEVYPEAISLRPFIYTFSSRDKKIGITLPSSGRIYLLNKDGSLYKGFPLKGSSYFSISSFPGLEDRFNLIVGNKDNFLYNYSVK